MKVNTMNQESTKKLSKKEILLNLLDVLIPYRNLAQGFKLLIQKDENLVNQFYPMIIHKITTIKEKKNRKKLHSFVSQLKAKEIQDHSSDEDYLESLLTL